MKALGRAWHLAATWVALTAFIVAVLLLSLLVLPLLSLCARDRWRGQVRVQAVVHHACSGFVGLLGLLGLMSYEVSGLEHLRGRGRLIIANHPSLVDVLFLLAWMPQLDCIVKQELWQHPLFAPVIRWGGYLGNAHPAGLVDNCADSLRQGRNLVVFPEGTRSVPGRPLRLYRGAARIAIKSGAEVVPVVIHCDPPVLIKGQKWYTLPQRPPHFRFMVSPPLCAEPALRPGESTAQAGRRITAQFGALLAAAPPPDTATAVLPQAVATSAGASAQAARATSVYSLQ